MPDTSLLGSVSSQRCLSKQDAQLEGDFRKAERKNGDKSIIWANSFLVLPTLK